MILSLLPIIICILIIVIVHNKKKKKREVENVLRTNLYNWSHKDVPPLFFETLFTSWRDASESPEEKIEALTKGYNSAIEQLEEFESILSRLNKWYSDGRSGLSFTLKNEEEVAQYKQVREDSDLALEMRALLPVYARLKRDWELFIALSTFEKEKIRVNEDASYRGLALDPDESEYNYECYNSAIDFAQRGYRLALNRKWERLCNSYPKLNNSSCHTRYMELANEGGTAFKAWKTFYMKVFLEIRENTGMEEWSDKMNAFLAKKKEYDPLYSCIRFGVSKYSSIYEIEDFSEQEINRIAKLYESGKLHGIYRKANDPKYNSSAL